MEDHLESKQAFAARCNVTPARVSQWLREGKITDAALEGEGRSAKIKVSVALEELDRTLDVSQRLGNGARTKIELDQDELEQPVTRPKTDTEKLAEERLRTARLTNARLTEEEAARRGIYTRTDEARAGLALVANAMMRTFEGALPDFAEAIAAEFELPQRDVLHLLKKKLRTVREAASQAARNQSAGIDAFRHDDLDLFESEGEA